METKNRIVGIVESFKTLLTTLAIWFINRAYEALERTELEVAIISLAGALATLFIAYYINMQLVKKLVSTEVAKVVKKLKEELKVGVEK